MVEGQPGVSDLSPKLSGQQRGRDRGSERDPAEAGLSEGAGGGCDLAVSGLSVAQ